jgi:RNA polymerase sigma-70 factor, ECF subfamily
MRGPACPRRERNAPSGSLLHVVTQLPTASTSRETDPAPEMARDFEPFSEANQRRLFGTLCLVTGDRGEAEELVQEAFLRIWERWESMRRIDDPAAYLYRTAFNLFRSRLRRAVRTARYRLTSQAPVDAFASVDDRADLVAALRALSPRQRAAIVLLDLLDLSSDEAGRLLGVRSVTVRSLASQGRRVIRTALVGVDG